MGSRMMHYCIASIIAEQQGLEGDSALEFLFGGVAPDIQPFMDGVKPKDRTHFIDRDEAGQGTINPGRFVSKYKERLQEPFYQGYLCHLVSDVVWNDMWSPYVEHLTEEERKSWLGACYRDFWRLNGRLAERYGLTLPALTRALPAIEMDEADYDGLVPMLLGALARDFAYEEQTMREPLELFPNDNAEIIRYIELCVDRALTELRALA